MTVNALTVGERLPISDDVFFQWSGFFQREGVRDGEQHHVPEQTDFVSKFFVLFTVSEVF